MNDYSKWENLKDSDDEEEASKPSWQSNEVDHETILQQQEAIDQWLRRSIQDLNREEQRGNRNEGAYRAPPELSEAIPFRKVTKEERKVLAMLVLVCHFEEGSTNLDRHPQMLDLFRHHRWLEQDPGALELLCRLHNASMKRGGDDPDRGHHSRVHESPEDARMRNMLMSAINTMAAPSKAECPGGLLELVNMICTPGTEHARELRLKWQKKEFAKDALFESLFPDLKKYSGKDGSDADGGWWEIWLMLGIMVFIVISVVVLLYMARAGSAPPPGVSNTTNTTTMLTSFPASTPSNLSTDGRAEL
jgi:hypothetical protein